MCGRKTIIVVNNLVPAICSDCQILQIVLSLILKIILTSKNMIKFLSQLYNHRYQISS